MKKHVMNLSSKPFKMIKEGNKRIELRLYDEKRKNISGGGIIEFTNTVDFDDTLCVKVRDLFLFESFDALYQKLPLLECGYTQEDIGTASPRDMENIIQRRCNSSMVLSV